ncbi:unnamed protein product [Tetraodon nigroviridis]|uniref:Cadherin-1 n=1 Tax=Tetraodon nigroviridis TaxID=99883 RepID=Q4T7X6_TETNG|nr:unnamed protein product [Tetraodon nigroviridis]
MGVAGARIWVFLFVAFQVSTLGTPEEQTCVPGFEQNNLILRVSSKHLRQRAPLGKVNFEDCTDRTRFSFSSSDGRVRAQTDGALTVKRPITLHEGVASDLLDSSGCEKIKRILKCLDSADTAKAQALETLSRDSNVAPLSGFDFLTPVVGFYCQRCEEFFGDWTSAEDHAAIHCCTCSSAGMEAQVPVVYFHKSGEGLKRRKRDMVIPPLSVAENYRGPYPHKISQIRSNQDKLWRIHYSISGPGADQPPVNLFTMDKVSGTLFVTQQLDREQQASYMFRAYAVAEGSGTAEEPMDIIVNVIDQNDNKPVFVKDTFLGEVPEASPTNFEVIQVEATDLDEPNSDNSDIRYKILSQEPKLPSDNLFAINPVTGVIRVNAGGLDREAGMEAQVPVVYFHKSGEGLKRRKREWVIPPISVTENYRGPYPHKISQLKAHAVAEGSGTAEDPMDIIVNVIDQNDNKPGFVKDTFLGKVPEASPTNFEVIQVEATDLDEPNSDNSDIRYKILSQEPKLPSDNLFAINEVTGAIRVNAGGLDREKYPEYTLEVQAADLEGIGLTGVAKVILTVTDSNDNAPAFTQASYETSVAENKADSQILRMLVTDGDEPHSAAWNAKFTIVSGDPGGFFSVKTGTNKQEGILSTAKVHFSHRKFGTLMSRLKKIRTSLLLCCPLPTKGLDFEKNSKHTLLIAVENEVPFAVALPTATATVVVTVQDVNEAPIFDPPEKQVSKGEDLPVGTDVVQYTASDPDTARKQKVMYRILNDPAGWLNVDKETGVIKVKTSMDRESLFVKDNKYTALIGAYDNDEVPATGTGTLMVLLEDVNDNAPVIEERAFQVCRNKPAPQLLSVTDKDGPGNGAPFSVSLQDPSRSNWTARMNDSKTGIILQLTKALESGQYTVVLRVADNRGRDQDNTVQATVCECTGEDNQCQERVAAGTNLPVILGVLAGILLLLMLVLLLLMFARRRRGPQKEPLLQDTDTRDNIFYYDEEGGGYDLSVLHRGLDNRPEVFRNDVMPNFMPAPQYQPRPANPEEIGNFIDNNLKTADNDPTAPPYDSLLVFDYEGGGSDSGSLSSLNSSSSGDQDYDCLSQWGPRFKKLADMSQL